jgi:hypothetical protein
VLWLYSLFVRRSDKHQNGVAYQYGRYKVKLRLDKDVIDLGKGENVVISVIIAVVVMICVVVVMMISIVIVGMLLFRNQSIGKMMVVRHSSVSQHTREEKKQYQPLRSFHFDAAI